MRKRSAIPFAARLGGRHVSIAEAWSSEVARPEIRARFDGHLFGDRRRLAARISNRSELELGRRVLVVMALHWGLLGGVDLGAIELRDSPRVLRTSNATFIRRDDIDGGL